jgi:hypothetical protein
MAGRQKGWIMKLDRTGLTMVAVVAFTAAAVSIAVVGERPAAAEDPAFGGSADVEFAGKLWKAMEGYRDWPMSSDVYPGISPHGAFLRVYYNMVHVDGEPYHLIVKDNFGGEGATRQAVADAPDDYLAAVTIMLQREPGYDSDNDNWFWVKYAPDGSIEANPKGMALAGRVAKGADEGCIACHHHAKGDDYLFSNDE